MSDDYYTRKARAQGLASRAVFKLQEMQKKHRLMKPGNVVIELGAAPGGWLQFISDSVGRKGRVLAIDLLDLHIRVPENVTFVKGDFDTEEIDTTISDWLEGSSCDVVLCDAAPNTSGIGFQDAARSAHLAMAAVEVSVRFLRFGGNLCFKIFAGDEKEVLDRVKKCFQKVVREKPDASKKKSREFYVVCLGFTKEFD